eukprot:682520-Pyramimonas_sp.AAC.1
MLIQKRRQVAVPVLRLLCDAHLGVVSDGAPPGRVSLLVSHLNCQYTRPACGITAITAPPPCEGSDTSSSSAPTTCPGG